MYELRAHGDTTADPLAPYRLVRRQPSDGRPWVLANMVVGLDGTAAIAGRVSALSSTRDAQLFRRLRALADVVLVGAGTVRQEGYGPIVLDTDLVRERADAGKGTPRIAIVSSSLDLSPELPVLRPVEGDVLPIVITTAASDRSRIASLPVDVMIAGETTVDVGLALQKLAERGTKTVLCEGGPMLLGELIAADLLDEYCLSVAPLVGGDPLPVVNTTTMTDLTRFYLHHTYVEDDTLFLNYLRVRQS